MCGIGKGVDADLAKAGGTGGIKRLERFIKLVKALGKLVGKVLAQFGCHNRPGRSIDQLYAKAAFQTADRVTSRRRRKSEFNGRSLEALAADNRQKQA